MDRFPKTIIFGGTCILGLTLAMGWGGVSMIIRGQVRKEIRIINNTDTYRAWKDFPLPLYISIYLFNITNPDDFMTGGKPKLQEVGPYVFMEKLHKTDLAQNMTTEIITFRQLRFYVFQPDMSTGSEDDMVTIPNVPLIGVAKIAQDLKEGGVDVSKYLEDLVSKKEELLTKTASVREVLFEGFPVSSYSGIIKESNGDPELEESPFTIPESFSGEKYGLFKNRNGTGLDGLFEIRNGRNYTYQYGQIVNYNGEEETSWWREPCNRVHGSDGLSFHPFINKTSPLYTFEPIYCRTLSYVYASSNVVQEVNSLRFVLSPETFQGPHVYPDNACYCPIENSTTCDRNGVYTVSPCYEGFPFMLSKPHFLDADTEIINGVEGMSPNPDIHDSFMEMHSMSGIPLKSAKRFQFSVELMPYPGVPALGDIPKIIVPIYWYQESVEAGSVHFLVFKIIAWIQNGWDIIKYGFVGSGALILGAGIVMGIMRKSTDSDRMVLVK